MPDVVFTSLLASRHIPPERARVRLRTAIMGGMAGLEGTEHTRRAEQGGPAARWTPGAKDERALAALDAHGNPAESEIRVEATPESGGELRRLAALVVTEEWRLSPALAETTALLVSELLGNAVRHAGARSFGLRMTRRPGRIRVEFRDPSRALPCVMPSFGMAVTSGYGLALVERLSERWGVDLLPVGKKTWFELRVTDR
ncbi:MULTISPECIES: ATP-binding protein [unclassified Streptomyces]|uniref:ATP-binding protein n=1 Tax=Streptomyces evansiae TaxID=3075535 RepID=A0ABD5E4E9_9ACTN|nr:MULTISPECIES: ATP-binding protein [unclassified Streptomyces]ASY32686.1 ATP-binding protein [Streptomyces sp. CLI2509]EGJ74601.1 putative regulatory protein [Streptomyces sp. Tu6071]MDT0415886.1 ATP-binding protein [Streptomyces sp. DSM 41982]MYX19989.1 ATP-binding protein [Streptomyces sp. SID8380]WEH29907.1 ATP-binding protein [Streptomyces sp. AM 3-1-1]